MEYYDFLFVYEVKNRELDNILLLKCELERRGYSIKLIETWAQILKQSKPINAKVAVTFALYDESNIRLVLQFAPKVNKILNLQWEQVFTNGDEATSSTDLSRSIQGIAKNAVHICWGNNTFDRLTNKFGINPNNACITGSVTLDFLRNEFADYYYSREEVIKQYGINRMQKIYLFISSFSYTTLPENIVNSSRFQCQGFDVKAHCRISKDSKKIILDWFKKELELHPEILIIYRPHPAEINSAELKEIENNYTNFRVINEMSIKQWILISDKIYTWWSTSIAEVFAAQKGCSILRPIEIPYSNEVQIYKNASMIQSFEEFDNSFLLPNIFPIKKEYIENFYFTDLNEPAFIKICNLLDEMIKNNDYAIDISQICLPSKMQKIITKSKISLKKFILNNEYIYLICKKILKGKKISNGKDINELKKEYDYYLEMANKNKIDESEIREKEKKIMRIINENYKY
jgi:surface carbohydrate biosynthesis protein